MKVPTTKGRTKTDEPESMSRRGSMAETQHPTEKVQTKGSRLSRTSSNSSLVGNSNESSGKKSASAKSEAVAIKAESPPPPINNPEKDDPEFMGEVESILQEHGIEVDPLYVEIPSRKVCSKSLIYIFSYEIEFKF